MNILTREKQARAYSQKAWDYEWATHYNNLRDMLAYCPENSRIKACIADAIEELEEMRDE